MGERALEVQEVQDVVGAPPRPVLGCWALWAGVPELPPGQACVWNQSNLLHCMVGSGEGCKDRVKGRSPFQRSPWHLGGKLGGMVCPQGATLLQIPQQ